MNMNIQNVSSLRYMKESVASIEKQVEAENDRIDEVEKEAVEAAGSNNNMEIDRNEVDESSEKTSPIGVSKTAKEYLELTGVIQKEIENIDVNTEQELIKIAKDLKESLKMIAKDMTDKDIEEVMKRHYSPEKISIDILKNIITHNKVAIKVEDYDKLNKEVMKQVDEYKNVFENEEDLKGIIQKLKINNIPVNPQNIEKVQRVLNKFDNIKELSNDEIICFLKEGKDVTIDHVYKSKFSATHPVQSMEDIKALKDQVISLINRNGIEVTDQTINLAEKMISNDVEFSDEVISKLKTILRNYEGIERETIINQACININDNQSVGDIVLSVDDENLQQENKVDATALDELLDQSKKVKIGDIRYAIERNIKLNLTNLVVVHAENEAQRGSESERRGTNNSESSTLSIDYEVIKAKLNMEEIRLKMTIEAADKMAQKGIDVKTDELQQVVEELHLVEEEALKEQMEIEKVVKTDDNVGAVKEVSDKIALLRLAPFSAISKVALSEVDFTIDAMAEVVVQDVVSESDERIELQLEAYKGSDEEKETDRQVVEKIILERKEANVSKVLSRYEVLETKPRKDMGDSIQKTFGQIESILDDLGLENTNENNRAVKILAYNSMEISKEQVEYIKNIDAKVNKVINELHPTLLLNLIKENKSPLNMAVDELIENISMFEEKYGITSFDKIAKIIYQMEADSELNLSEKEGVIGIYRMLSTITNTKGRAAGFLHKNDMSVTVENLFEAAKYIRKTGGNREVINHNIDDDFGLLKEINYENKPIKEIVRDLYKSLNIVNTKENSALVDSMLNDGIALSKEAFVEMQNISHEIERLINKEVVAATENSGINQKDNAEIAYEVFENILPKINQLTNEDLKLLSKYQLAKDIRYINSLVELKENPFILSRLLDEIMADQKLPKEYREEIIETIKKLNVNEKEKDYDKKIRGLDETLNRIEKEVVAAQSNGEGIHKAINKAQIASHINRSFAEDGFYQMPLMINGKLSQINMYYFDDKASSKSEDLDEMKVYLTFKTQHIGQVEALMTIKDQAMDFKICSNQPEGFDAIKKFSRKFEQVLRKTAYNINSIEFDYFKAEIPLQKGKTDETTSRVKKSTNTNFEISI